MKKTILAGALLALSGGALALPTGGTFVQGSGGITPSGSTLDVNIATAPAGVATINWAGFNIGAGEIVNFTSFVNQINTTVVNVDQSGAMSQILGTLRSSSTVGQRVNVVLVNPNGVNIGSSAAINTAGMFVAAAGTVDTTTPGGNVDYPAARVAIHLNNAPVTIDPAASIAVNHRGGETFNVRWVATPGQNTLPAVFDGVFRPLDSVGMNGTGITFNMGNSRGAGWYQLPKNSVVNVNDSRLAGQLGFYDWQAGNNLVFATCRPAGSPARRSTCPASPAHRAGRS